MTPSTANDATVPTCISREIHSDAETPNRTGIDFKCWRRSTSTSWHAYSTSNPPTHNPIANPRSQGSQPAPPPAASHPPIGAMAIARPRNSWVAHVNRLASEYQKMMPSATGDNTRHNRLNWAAATTKPTDITTTNAAASAVDMRPVGI